MCLCVCICVCAELCFRFPEPHITFQHKQMPVNPNTNKKAYISNKVKRNKANQFFRFCMVYAYHACDAKRIVDLSFSF